MKFDLQKKIVLFENILKTKLDLTDKKNFIQALDLVLVFKKPILKKEKELIYKKVFLKKQTKRKLLVLLSKANYSKYASEDNRFLFFEIKKDLETKTIQQIKTLFLATNECVVDLSIQIHTYSSFSFLKKKKIHTLLVSPNFFEDIQKLQEQDLLWVTPKAKTLFFNLGKETDTNMDLIYNFEKIFLFLIEVLLKDLSNLKKILLKKTMGSPIKIC